MIFVVTVSAASISFADVEYQKIKTEKNEVDVIKVVQLQDLTLRLNNPKGHPYYHFLAIQNSLKPCEKMHFAMNAGMYHADFSPVGLYIEDSRQQTSLNEKKAFGNFYMQPNGVLAWNNQRAVIQMTKDYKNTNFKAKYATQSGPMLVIDGKLNSQFVENSNSLKIRNGVGLKNNQLYFLISRDPITFYAFATIFKDQLKITNALYLDGSISSAYIPQAQRNDQVFNLGPIIAYIQPKFGCQ
nr:phosphodiester glycosidase family protein [Acinetobacter sp. ANC 4648]